MATGDGRTPVSWSARAGPISPDPVEVTDRTLSEEERLRVLDIIHRQAQRMGRKKKKMVAYRLVDIIGASQRR